MNERDLFIGAIQRDDPAQRRQFVHEACGADEALRRRVEDLLSVYDRASAFPESLVARPEATLHQPSTSEAAGMAIGPYKLIEQIGEGGMGTVWMAQQTEPVKRVVALKLIKAGMDSKAVIARFEAERQALALMDHPNIAKVLDGGTASAGRPYFVMDLVKGAPITKYCDEHQFTPRQRLELFIPVCQAVQHAHQKGIIHRDLKPSNVMVALYDGKPVPKVIDFGVAKATGQSLTDKTLVTGFGNIVGTLEYMSPEQAEINQLDIDTRSDIYSLGVLLYELLAGSPPFSRKELEKAGMLEMLRVIREQEPSKPSTKLSSSDALPTLSANRGTEPAKLTKLVRGELDWIVMRALEKDRSRRYDTANGFARDLQRYLADEPVQACPPSAGYRLRKFVRRNKAPVLAACLVAVALLGGIVGTTWGMIRATDAQAVAVHETNQKEAALQMAQQREQDARDQLFEALLNQARAGRFSGQLGQRLDSLTALAKAAGLRPDERLRNEAIAAMALPDVRRAPGWRSSAPGNAAAVAYSANYQFYARAEAQGTISIRSIPDDRQIRLIVSGPITGWLLYFSPDDRFLVGLVDRKLRVWRVADGQLVLRDDANSAAWHAFSTDGQQLAVGQKDAVVCFDLATRMEVKRWRLPAPPFMLAFNPDNSKLAVGYSRFNVVSIFDASKGDLIADLPVGGINEPVVAWHPDGELLAVAGSDARIHIWNVFAKHVVARLEGHSHQVGALTFHPDGSLLASHGWDGMMFLWDPATGRQLMRFAEARMPRFSPDGRWLGAAWHGDSAELLEVIPSREYRTLANSTGRGRHAYDQGDISPDGRLLVVGMWDCAVLWDLCSGRELARLPQRTPYVSFEAEPARQGEPKPQDVAQRAACAIRALLTSGPGGLLRWPVQADEPLASSAGAEGSVKQAQCLRLGPPQQLSSLQRAWFARSTDGGTLAVATEEGGANKLLDSETGAVRRELGIHPSGEVRALSADGRWAASSGWHSDRVRLWNARSGELIHEWTIDKRNYVFFTPDSRTLIIARGDEFSFWDVETFQPIRRLRRDIAHHPGHVAFSPDGKLMALEMDPASIHLKDAATGRTIAKLEDPHGDRSTWLGFTPDGAQLVAASTYASAVHVWDLRAIRARLKEMKLDWDWPEFLPAAPGKTAVETVTIAIDRGDGAVDKKKN